MSSSNDDGQQNFIVGFLFALIALVLFLVIGIAIRHVHGKAGVKPVVAMAGAAAPAMAIPAINEELAKKRAQTVQQLLVSLGVPADKVDLQKPAVTTGSGSNAQARRVEVKLVD